MTAHAETLTLTLEQAIDLGAQNSSSVKSAWLAVQSAEKSVDSVRASNYPSVSLSSRYTHLFEKQVQGGTYVSSADPVSVSAELNQNITSFGKIKSGVRVAEERFQSGLVPDYEVLSAESDLESFKPELIEAENQLEYARLEVMDILGLEVTEEGFDIELIGTLEENYHDFDREELIQRALLKNFNILVSQQSIALRKRQNELNSASKRPTISGFATYSLTSGVDTATGEPRYWGKGSWDGDLSAGVLVQVPVSSLFSWSSENAGVRQGKIELEKLNVELESTVKLQIENSLLSLEKKASQITSGKKAVKLARRLHSAALDRYNNGLITSLDLQDVQLNLNKAQLGYLEALHGYNAALFDLMDIAGLSNL